MNSRQKKSRQRLTTNPRRGLAERVAELERQVADLERGVAMLKQLPARPVFAAEGGEPEAKRKPGPKEKISDTWLFQDRDALIIWLEPFWPWLADRLVARTAAQVEAILEAIVREPSVRPGCQERMLQNASVLHEFLWSERFRKTVPKAAIADALKLPSKDERQRRAANRLPTRQIANAMAGVPDLAWRTSLDRCSGQPSTVRMAYNLEMYYRDLLAIPAPKGLDLTGFSSPVPKPLRPVLARTGDRAQKRDRTGPGS